MNIPNKSRGITYVQCNAPQNASEGDTWLDLNFCIIKTFIDNNWINKTGFIVKGSGDRALFAGGMNSSLSFCDTEFLNISSLSEACYFGYCRIIDNLYYISNIDGTSNGINSVGIMAGGAFSQPNSSPGGDCLTSFEMYRITTPSNIRSWGGYGPHAHSVGIFSNKTRETAIAVGGICGESSSGFFYTRVLVRKTISTSSSGSHFADYWTDIYNVEGTSNGVNDRGIFDSGNINNKRLNYINISGGSNSQTFGNLAHGNSSCATSNDINDRAIFLCNNFSEFVTISTTSNSYMWPEINNSLGTTSTSNGSKDRAVMHSYSGGNSDVYYFSISNTYSNATQFTTLLAGKSSDAAMANS